MLFLSVFVVSFDDHLICRGCGVFSFRISHSFFEKLARNVQVDPAFQVQEQIHDNSFSAASSKTGKRPPVHHHVQQQQEQEENSMEHNKSVTRLLIR